MKNNNIKTISYYKTRLSLLFINIIFLYGCEDMISLKESPPHIMTTDVLFQDYSGFETAINGLYSTAREELTSRRAWEGSKTGTDGYIGNYRDAGPDNFSSIVQEWGAVLNSTNPAIEEPWRMYYKIINIANNIIAPAKAENSHLSEAQKNLILADAKAVRAWAYRHLTYLYGDVAVTLTPSSGATIKRDWTRTPVADVRAQMIEDWLFAAEHLPVEATLAGRMTKGAVQHYLAEMFIVNNNYSDAILWADKAINNPAYTLVTERYGAGSDEPGVPFMDMFRDENADRESGNTEALWVMQFAEGVTGGELYVQNKRQHKSRYHSINIGGVVPLRTTASRGGEGRGYVALTVWAIDLYEPEDDRGSEYALRKFFVLQDAEGNHPQPADRLPPGWNYGDTLHLDWSQPITAQTNRRANWPYSRKVDWTNPATPGMRENYKNIPYLRLAETYLLKAEAQYLNGDVEAAAETINIIRRRSNASEIDVGDVDIDFILDERQRELVAEEQRRYTLLRTGKWLERTRKYSHNGGDLITERDVLFPIPQNVIDANITEFPQNPGFF